MDWRTILESLHLLPSHVYRALNTIQYSKPHILNAKNQPAAVPALRNLPWAKFADTLISATAEVY